jgi:hypothetical protein
MRPIEGGYIYNLRVSTSTNGVPVGVNDALNIIFFPSAMITLWRARTCF